MRLSLVVVLATGLLGLAVASGAATSGPHPVRESVQVSLVEVPVQVIGRDGKPIRGLKTMDFQLEDEGKEQTILSADEIVISKRSRASATNDVPAVARRHFLLLFDFSFASADEIARSRDAALRFAESSMSPSDLAAVATVSAEGGLRLLLTFSPDRQQLAAAIRQVGLPSEIDRQRDPLSFAAAVPGDLNLVQQEGYQSTFQPVDPTAAQKIYEKMERKVRDDFNVTRVQRHLSDLAMLGRALDLISGRKTILFFSEGFDGRLLVGNLAQQDSIEQTNADNDAMMHGAFWSLDVDRRYADGSIQRQLGEAAELLRRSDCTIYAIDIAGIRDRGDTSVGSADRGTDSLFALAHDTGGELIRNRNDLTAATDRVAEQTEITYVLSYRPSGPSEEGKYHKLRVRTRIKGARVVARAGYYDSRSFRQLTPLERVLSAADILANETPARDLPLGLSAVSLPGEKGMASIPVWMEVGGKSLLEGQKGQRLVAMIYVYAYDSRNQLSDYRAQRVELGIASIAEKLATGGLRYCDELKLPAGSYRLRALVRNEETGKTGASVLELDVPDFTDRRAHLLSPVFLGNSDGAVLVRGRLAPEATRDGFPAYPLLTLPFMAAVPEPLPEVAVGKPSLVSVVAYNLGKSPDLRVGGSVLDSEGKPIGPAALSVSGQIPDDERGKRIVIVDFTPSSLTPGRYVLRVFLRDMASGFAAHASAPFVVP